VKSFELSWCWAQHAVNSKEEKPPLAVIRAGKSGQRTVFSVAGLLGPSGGESLALNAASRRIALLIAVLCSMGFRARDAVASLALVKSLV
jgi:hypothetical protein